MVLIANMCVRRLDAMAERCPLSAVRADDLAAIPLAVLKDRNSDVDWASVDDVILGCANQAGEDNRDIARMAVLLAGLPVEIGGTTIIASVGLGWTPSSRRQEPFVVAKLN